MGCDCTNTLLKTAKEKDVQDFLGILGYEKYSHNCYFYYDKKSRVQITGITAFISDNLPIQVHTRTTVWRSIKDHEIHNWTIKQLRNRFGGYFYSDKGKNRYLKFNNIARRGADAGCDLAYFDFRNNFATLQGFLQIIKNNEKQYPIDDITKQYNPLISSTNIGLPFLISILEEYLRDSYISLLKYSSNKKEILKKSNIQTEELIEVAENRLSIENVISRFKSFQNIELINRNFKEIRNDLSFIDTLKRFNPRLKYDQKLIAIITKRHNLIHRFQMDYDYSIKEFEKDLKLIEKVVQIFYDKIISIHNWEKREL